MPPSGDLVSQTGFALSGAAGVTVHTVDSAWPWSRAPRSRESHRVGPTSVRHVVVTAGPLPAGVLAPLPGAGAPAASAAGVGDTACLPAFTSAVAYLLPTSQPMASPSGMEMPATVRK